MAEAMLNELVADDDDDGPPRAMMRFGICISINQLLDVWFFNAEELREVVSHYP